MSDDNIDTFTKDDPVKKIGHSVYTTSMDDIHFITPLALYVKRDMTEDLIFLTDIGVIYRTVRSIDNYTFFITYDYLTELRKMNNLSDGFQFIIVANLDTIYSIPAFIDYISGVMNELKENIMWGVKYEDWDKWVTKHRKDHTDKDVSKRTERP